MSIRLTLLEPKVMCDNIGCKNEIKGFALKKHKRFCMRCQWSKLQKRWKCKREGCNNIMESESTNVNRYYCSGECLKLERQKRDALLNPMKRRRTEGNNTRLVTIQKLGQCAETDRQIIRHNARMLLRIYENNPDRKETLIKAFAGVNQ